MSDFYEAIIAADNNEGYHPLLQPGGLFVVKTYLINEYQLKVLTSEITRLRADLAAAIEERDRIREALRPFAAMASVNNMQDYAEAPDDCVMTAGSWGNKPLLTFRLGDLRRARAAIEVVTKKEGAGNE